MTDETVPNPFIDTGAAAPAGPATQPAPADANPFAEAAGQVMHAERQSGAAQIRNNLIGAVGQNPDQAAQYQHLAKYVGVPVATVQAQPEAIKQQAALQQMDAGKITTDYPVLGRYLTVPDNMAKSHDDIAPLGAVEHAVKALPAPSPASAPPTFGDDVMANVRGLADVPGELVKGLGGAFNKAAGAVNLVAGAVPTLYDKAASLITGKPTTAMSDAYFKSMVDPLLANQAAFSPGKDASFVAKAANTGGALLGALSQITLTGGGSAAAAPAESVAGIVGQAAEHGAKSMAFPALTDAVTTAKDVYQQTGDAGAALRAAQGQYLATTSAGVVPLSAPGGLLARAAGGAVSGAVSGEANRQLLNMVLPATMAQPFDMESLVLSGLAGAGLGAVMGPRAEPSYMDAVRSAQADATKAAQAEQGAQGLQALGELASASKTRERDPAGFRDLVQNMTEDGNLQDVYVDANKFAEVLSQSNVTIEQLAKTMPDVADQLQEAIHTNGDIRIPVEDYATHIAGGPVDAALLPHLKTDPDGFTYQQGQEYFANQQTEMRAQADQLGAAKEAEDKAQAEAQVVHDKVLDQLNATGRFQPAVNNAYAALTRDFYSTMAERAGTTPAELYEHYPLKITGEPLTGEGLDQSGYEMEHRPPGPEDGAPAFDLTGDGNIYPEDVYGPNGARYYGTGHAADKAVFQMMAKLKGKPDADVKIYRAVPNDEKITSVNPGDWVAVSKKYAEDHGVGLGDYKVLEQTVKAKDIFTNGDSIQEFGYWPEGTYDQGERGSFNPATNTIGLLKAADLSTYLHESGHFFLETMHDIARSADAPDGVKSDFDTLLKSFGVAGDTPEARLADWSAHGIDGKRDGHETFARGFEAYLMEGKAPTLALQGLFSRFRSWLVNIYKSLTTLNVELSPEVRGVMDRMIASDEAIRQAEQARAYFPIPNPEKIPTVVEGYTRLYHGGEPGENKGPLHFSTSQEYAAGYAEKSKARVWYVDVPTSEYRRLAGGDDEYGVEPSQNVELPGDIAGKRKVLAPSNAEQFAAYQNLGKEATDQALADMTARSIRDIKWLTNAKSKALRGLQKEAAGARKEIQDEVTKEVNAEPVNQARASLKKGKLIGPDGQESPDIRPLGSPKIKLRRADVEALYPESMLNRPDLDPLKGLSAKEGLDPDIVADMFGYPDGRALLDDLLHGENAKDKIEGMTDQRMLEQHGELSDPVSIERAAEAAIHNDARARFVATGLKLLSKSPVSATALAKAAKDAAEASIAAKRVRDLRPSQHAAAEARANKDVIKLAPNDPAGAVQAQRAALLNNRLFKAATEAVAEVTKGVDYLKKFDKQAVREKLALDYRDQIDTLLDRFDLRKSITNTALDGRESLLNFVERMAAQGNEPQVPEALLNEARTTHYKDMTVEEFRGLLDAVKSIETMGRKAQMAMDGAEMRDIAALADEARETMAALPQRDGESNRGLSRIDAAYLAVKSSGRSLQASLLKMEQMMDWLDNRNPNGVMNRVVFRRIADAGVHEADLQKSIKSEIDKLVESHLADITKDKGVFVADGLIDGVTGKPQRFTKKEMLALAGNMGNESNLGKLLAGEKWSETAVWDFLNKNMKKADWDFVAGLGATLEKLWPEKLAMSRRLGNTSPEKIAPRPFDTPHGRYDGWYWPLAYDPARSQDVAERGARAGDELFENIYSRANTDTGRMNTRNENYARPLLLSLDVIPRIIKDEIHDVAYREAIIDADKFLSNSVVRKGIISALSQEHYDQLRPWLQSIANDRKVDMQALKWFDALAHGARTRATIVGLGYRLSTILVHGSSAALESIAEVGPVWFSKGLADFAGSPIQTRDFVFTRSGEMRNRMNEVDRDVREHIREIDTRMMDTTSSAIQRGSDLMKAHAYQGIAMLDMGSALPTWMGAYHKAMDPKGLNMNEQDAIYFADKTVRNAHGGTGVKDMAAIQRGPEFLKLFTMFYTFWNHNINRLMDTARLAGDAETWKDGSKAANVIMKFLIYTLGIQTLHSIVHPSKDDEGDTNWLKWAGKEFTSAAFSGIPVLRDLAAHYINGKDYSATPAAGMVDTIGASGVDAANALTGKEAHPKVLKHTITTAGYVFGLPTGQLASSGQFLWDVSQDKQDPQTAQDWWNGMLHGDINKH